MIDGPKMLRDYLLTVGGLTALVSTRIYAERNNPPPGYDPGRGGAVCFKERGGTEDYNGLLLWPSIQFKCYGASELVAGRVYRALYDALNLESSGNVLHAEIEALGETLRESDTGWVYNLSYFRVMILNNA